MNAIDQGRVNRARQRLESAAQDGPVNDPAIRIVKLNPPEEGGQPVRLNRHLTMLSGLSRSGARTVFATIEGMTRDVASAANSLDASNDGPNAAAETSPDPHTTTLLDIIDSCEQALLLSGAEIRGADMALADLDEQIRSAQENPPTRNNDDAGTSSAAGVSEFVAQVLHNPADALIIEQGLAALLADPRRIALHAACSLDLDGDSGFGGPKLFGSSSRVQTNLVRAEAEGELSEYDMAPGSPAYVLASRLDHVGIPTSPLDAAEVAKNVLAEIEAARHDQAAFEQSLETLTGLEAELASKRDVVVTQRSATARRQATHRHLHQIARSQIKNGGGRRRGLMPVLIEEPFSDLPDELTHATLAMLLEHSKMAQVILVTDRSDVRAWFSSNDDRFECVDALGWFAEERQGW